MILIVYLKEMEIISNTIQTTLDSFDFAFCIIVNVLTYLIITVINDIKKPKVLTTLNKRLVLLGVILLTGMIYYFIKSDIRTIINSAILAPVFWSWILKPICKKFDIDYKKLGIND